MPLDAYSPPISRVRDSRAARVVLEQNTTSQTDENGIQVSGAREVHQEGEHDHAQHWGFSSRPAQGTEFIEILDQYGSRVAVAERIPCPVALADGDACLWTSATSYVKINAAGAVAVRSKAGQKVSLGTGGAAAKVARLGDAVSAATTMAAWIGKVQAVVVAIDHTTVAPTDFGTISAGSNNVEAD